MKANHHSTFSLRHSTRALLCLCVGALLVSAPPATAATVAWWRFEAGPANANVSHGGAVGVFTPDIPDSSGHGNALSVWTEGGDSGYAYRADVPGSIIPRTGDANNYSVQNTGRYPAMFTQSGTAMQSMQPNAFTIEASFKPETNGYRTLVGRDSQGTATFDPNQAALYFQIRPDNSVCIAFCDVPGYWHAAVSASNLISGFTYPNSAAGHWYHMAGVSDGTNLSLYLNSGFGYRLVARTDMTPSGSTNTALTKGLGGGSDWSAGNWSVGRGLYAGGHTDRAYGLIDEVRISDVALAPDQFLFSAIVLTSTADSGPGTLREALANADNGDTIDATGLSGIIILTSGELSVSKSVTILGPGPGALTVSGNFSSRVFNVTGTNVTISGLAIAYGQADKGGGIYNNATLTITNCIVGGNWANAGGGIYNDGSWQGRASLTVDTTTLSGNTAATWGGGIFNDGQCSGYADLRVSASTLNGNWAGDRGGGIGSDGYAQGVAKLWINGSTFSGNGSANAGGGIFNDGYASSNALVEVSASTFSGNWAATNGGGIFNYGPGGSATVELGDSILLAGDSGANIFNDSGTVISHGYNLSSDGGGGYLNQTGDQIYTDPKLGPLQDNGGPTWTCALLSGSPAIDRGKRDAISGLGLATDQRGFTRPVDFAGISNATGGDGSDIGAFEAQITLGCGPMPLTGSTKCSDGSFLFCFTNTPCASFTVFTTANLALPFSNWDVLGVPVEVAPGQFQFTDAQATNSPQRFYRVSSP